MYVTGRPNAGSPPKNR